MSLRRLYHEQPESFAFTPENAKWADNLISRYPEGRQASAVIPLLWRGQEQEGWVTRPMIETVAAMLEMEPIRVLEVATFYFMFQLQPVGSVAHVQVCGTTSCMICGAEDLIAVCREKIAPNPHQVSADGKLSWEEVECLGACSNAPMAQIGKDYYEDLTTETFSLLLDRLADGEVPTPGPQNFRWASEPASGLTSLTGERDHEANASIAIALQLGDTVKRIDGSDPLPRWDNSYAVTAVPEQVDEAPAGAMSGASPEVEPEEPEPLEEAEETAPMPSDEAADATEAEKEEAAEAHVPEDPQQEPDRVLDVPAGEAVPTEEDQDAAASGESPGAGEDAQPRDLEKPELLSEPQGEPDDLKRINGIGPKLEKLCNELGIYHFHQIANWSDAEVAWVDEHLEGFSGRIERDEWVSQARALAAE